MARKPAAPLTPEEVNDMIEGLREELSMLERQRDHLFIWIEQLGVPLDEVARHRDYFKDQVVNMVEVQSAKRLSSKWWRAKMKDALGVR